MRIVIFCAIVLLVSFGASAQEERGKKTISIPPQHAVADGITLNVIGATPPGKDDLKHTLVFPKDLTRDEAIDACAKELAEFLKHKFPEQVELKARVATCVVPEEIGAPS